MVATVSIIIVLVTTLSLISASPSIPHAVPEITEIFEDAPETSAEAINIAGEPGKPEPKNLRDLLPDDTQDNSWKRANFMGKPKFVETNAPELTVEQRRIKYGKSWGPGGKVVKWIWEHIIKPPFKGAWNLIRKRVIRPKAEFGDMTESEVQKLLESQNPNSAEKLTPKTLAKLAAEAKERSSSRNRFAWFQKTKPKTSADNGNIGLKSNAGPTPQESQPFITRSQDEASSSSHT